MAPRFVSEEDVADGANVATLEVGTVGAVPAGLQAAADTVCGKDGQQGKVGVVSCRLFCLQVRQSGWLG